ncbi:MAG: S41 family peptidase [Bacteroides sp.]|nr:S41 family peptidase [Bacteroides sp.]
MKKIITTLLLIAGVAVNLFAEAKFSRQQAIEDIDSLVRIIEDVEVNPYMTLPKETFHKAVSDTKASLTDDSVSIFRHYLNLSFLTGMFRQGHLSMRSPNFIWNGMTGFPLSMITKIASGSHEAIIDEDIEIDGVALRRGSKLLKINGRNVNELVDRYQHHFSGETDAYRCLNLSTGGFGFCLSLETPNDSVYTVEYLDPDGKKLTHKFKAIPFKKMPKRPTTASKEPYTYELLNDSVMLFTFNSCQMEGFRIFARKMFAAANRLNVRHLIIDIRNNPGGNSDTGDEICRYITDRPFNGFGGMKAKFSYTQARATRSRFSGDRIVDRTDMNEYDMHLPYDPAYRFNGKTYLLTSTATYSSAANFAWEYWKFVPGGTIIGEETGGVNIAVGDVVTCQLPHSKFTLIAPWKIFYHYGSKDGDPIHGTIPHIQVPADRALDRTLEHIQGK